MVVSSREEVIVGGSVRTTSGRERSFEQRSSWAEALFVFVGVGLVFSALFN
jgi:hypothetical protein